MLKKILLTCVSGALILLYGCSNPSTTENASSSASQSKIFRYNQAEGLTSLDPAMSRTQANIWATSQIYNGLFEFTEDLSEHPSLVETWDISPDGLSYTFTIRENVYFQNSEVFPDGKGRIVTSEDFVYSFKRILDPQTASSGVWVFNDKVLRDKNGNISDTCFKAISPRTFKIYLNKPFPPFLKILAMPYTYVVPKEAVEKYGKEFGRKPVGTGPFLLKDWDEGNSLILTKNSIYWRKDHNHNPLPYLDAIQVSFISDKNVEFLTFKQGKLDMISGDDPSIIEQILKKDGTPRDEIGQKYKVEKIPYLSTEYLGFQLDPSKYQDPKHPFLDLKIRQALSYAINRDELVSFVRNNLGNPATNGFVPSALPSFDEGKVKGYGFDPDKAKQLLKEAGYPDGKNFPSVTLNTTTVQQVLAEHLQRQWEKILGITIKVEVNNFAAHQEMVESGQVKFFRGAWLGDYPDEENFLACFYSPNHTPAGPNKTHFRNPEFDKLFDEVHQESDGWKRHGIYHKLDQIVMNECPVIVLFYDEVLQISQKNIKGLETNAMHTLSLEKVDVESVDVAPVN